MIDAIKFLLSFFIGLASMYLILKVIPHLIKPTKEVQLKSKEIKKIFDKALTRDELEYNPDNGIYRRSDEIVANEEEKE